MGGWARPRADGGTPGAGAGGPRRSRRGPAALALVLGALGASLVPTASVAVASPRAAAPCDPPVASPIACENSKPGTPQSVWYDVDGSGDPSIQGFTTDISVDHGQTVTFKVSTPATAYHLDVYRMGWYQGNGARLVTTLHPDAVLPQSQPACLFDAAVRMTDCGNWAPSAHWNVPADAVSGIYLAKLVRDDGTPGSSYVVFVVRDDERHANVLFQTSDATWHAYNRYGGYSVYYPTSAQRAYQVSYDRPIVTRDCCDGSFVFSDEYPMVRWLEANGYDVSYTTDVDSARSGAQILNHRAFLSVGHDEYWSGEQRTNVEAARDAGVNLAFFSGNESFWKTRWLPSIDGSTTPYRTLVTYKETYGNAKIDPSPTWTGTWRDPRFSPPSDGGRPENALTGTLYTVNCCSSDPTQEQLAIQVPADDGKMRFWRNTSIASLQTGQVATLPDYTLGYEWDEDVDNGSRPAGLFHLSTTTKAVPQHLIDAGNTYVPGTATHHLDLYRAASGALVFGAGTIRWSWGLDGTHDLPASTPSQDMRQATVNLFADMGVQPATLQAGLVTATASTDVVAPTATITAPAPGTTLTAETPVSVTGTAADTGGGQVAGVEVSLDGGASWHPATGRTSWSYAWTPTLPGSLTILARAVDDSGNLGPPSQGVTVTVTPRACPCTIWPSAATPRSTSASTAANELGVKFRADYDGSITGIRFYKAATNTGTHVGHLWTRTGGSLGSVTFSNETASGWQQASFATPIPVAAGTTYVASYFDPNGGYSQDAAYFASAGYDRAPLHALANGVDGPNGVYRYGSSGFPTLSYNSSNYWVDVVIAISPPAAPAGLTAAAAGSEIDLAWNDVAQESGFQIQRSTDGVSAWSAVGTTGQAVTAYRDAALPPGTTFYYRVLATNPGGASAPSAVASATTPQVAPPAPIGLTATASSTTRIDLAWSTVVGESGDLSFEVQRSLDGISGWAAVGTTTMTAYADTGLIAATPYWYRLLATNAVGSSPPSNVATTATRPSAPSGLSATTMSKYQINLLWSDVYGETGFRVERSIDGGTTWTTAGTTAAGATGFADTGLAATTTYTYRVFAEGQGGESGPSNLVSATTLQGPPSTPTGLVVTSASASELDLSWNDVTAETQYSLQRSTDGGSTWTPTGATPANATTFADTGLPAATSFTYRVLASNAYGVSAPSASAAGVTRPAAPSAVTALALTPNEVDVAWADVAGESSYQIQRSTDGGVTWPQMGTTSANRTAFADTTLAPSSTVSYRIVAVGAGGASAPSPAAPATTPAACPCTIWTSGQAPSRFDRSGKGNEVGVKFRADANGQITGIRFFKGTADTGTHAGDLWTRSGTLLASATFTNETASGWQQVTFGSPVAITAGTTYVASYWAPNGGYAQDVNAFAATGVDRGPLHALANNVDGPNGVYRNGTSGFPKLSYQFSNYWVDVVFAYSPTVAPTGLTATVASPSEVDLAWTDVAGETGYRVQRSADGGLTWTQAGASGSNVTSFADLSLAPGTPYVYRVVAVNPAGDSPPSATVNAATPLK